MKIIVNMYSQKIVMRMALGLYSKNHWHLVFLEASIENRANTINGAVSVF